MKYDVVTYIDFYGNQLRSVWAKNLTRKNADVKRKEYEKLTEYKFVLEKSKVKEKV